MNRTFTKPACLVGGLATTVMATLLVIAGVMIPGFSVTFELYRVEFEYNFSMFLYIGLIFAGLAIASMYYKQLHVVEKKHDFITSIPWPKLLAGALLLAFGAASLAVFGISFTDTNMVGLWLYLGGPSLFLPTGLLPLIIGIVLVIYSVFAIKDIEVKRSENALTISEKRPFHAVEATIPVKDIKVARLSKATTGPRLLWIFVFGFQAYLLLVDGITFITNPFRFGTGTLVGAMYITSAAVQVAAMALLLFGGNVALRIITSDNIYSVNFTTTGKEQASLATLPYFLGGLLDTRATKDAKKLIQGRDIKRVLLGTIMIVGAITSKIFTLYSNDVFRFILLALGSMLVVEGIKNDNVRRDPGTISVVQGPNTAWWHVTSNRGAFRDEYMFANVEVPAEPSLATRKVSFPDHFIGLGLALLAGLDAGTVLLLSPGAGALSVAYVILHVAIDACMVAAAMVFMVDPRSMLEIKTGARRYQVLASAAGMETRKWFPTWLSAWIPLKGVPVAQLVKVACAFVLGFAVAMFLLFA